MGQALSRPFWTGSASQQEDAVHGHWIISEEAIRLRAYFISLETGGRDPARDWQRAEEEFLAEAGQQLARDIANAWNYH